MRASSFELAIVLVFALTPALMAQDMNAIAKFKSSAFSAWEQYRRLHTRNMSGSWESKLTRGGKLETPYFDVEIKQNQNGRLFLAKTFDAESQTVKNTRVSAHNKDYLFELYKQKDAPAWVLTEFTLDKSKIDAFVARDFSTLSRGLDVLLTVDTFDLSALFARPYFKIVRGKFVQLENKEFVELEFESFHDIKKKPQERIQRGVFLFDPSNFWCLKRATFEKISFPDMPAKAVVEYAYRSEGGVPVPESIIMRGTSWGTLASNTLGLKSEFESRIDYKVRLVAGGVPDDQFYLSAFGLPEPMGQRLVDRGGSRWYIWFSTLAIVCLVVGWYCRRTCQNPLGPNRKQV